MAAPIKNVMAAFFNCRMFLLAFGMLISSVIDSESARLSDPKILLPYHTSVVTNFSLKINLTKDESRSPNCYTWKSSRLDVATVQLINSTDNECALSAEISAVSKSSLKKTSIVMVENKVTGEVLKCIVIVDTLSRIEIETTTRLLYMEDSPEEMLVRGYDADGNVFSSLQGLEFDWSLHSDTSGRHDDIVDANAILRILRFSESHYSPPAHIERLEEHGRQGDRILVEGIKTGSAFVWAKIRDRSYSSVKHSIVRIMVIANLMVSPPEAYVLKHATVKYKVEQIKQDSVITIQMPSSQFYLEVVDRSVSSLDPATSIATALELGDTEVKLIDKNIKISDQLVQPSAVLHVVNPSFMGFTVLPDRKWVLETGRVYTILIDVYDEHSHKLYPSDNLLIQAMFPKEFFDVKLGTTNGTYHIVKTLQKGTTTIDGSLNSVIKADGYEHTVAPPIRQSQFVEIFDPILIQPSLLVFPWDPVTQTTHRYQLRAQGGSGDYLWSTSNASVVTVNKYGEVTTYALGHTEVVASDLRNQLHQGVSKVHILPPFDMEFKPQRVEVVVGGALDLPLDIRTLMEGRRHSFNDCRNLPINVTFSDTSVFEYVDGYSILEEGSCRIIKVKAVQQGHTEVKVSYDHGKVKLQSSITIAAYDPLEPVDPDKEAVVALGSSKEVVFSGGPQPWVLDSSKYFQITHNGGQKVTAGEAKNVWLHPVKTFGSLKRLHSFLVTCRNFGEQTLTLRVGNEATARNKNPAVEEAYVSFVCGEPVEIHLQPQISFPQDLPPCPVSREPNQQIPIHCKKDLDILVVVTDKHGRRFDNISSLEFEWTLSDETIASLPYDLESDVKVTPSGRKQSFALLLLRPGGMPGSVVLTARVSQYRQDHLDKAQATAKAQLSPTISKSLELRLVEEAVVSPESVSVFNHPSNRVTLEIARGSGYFHMVEGKAGVVGAKYQEKTKQIQVAPLTDGQSVLSVYDVCVASSKPAQVSVTVSGVGSIELSLMDKVEIGRDIQARVQVLDVTGHKLFASFFPLMGLTLHAASDIITVKPDTVSLVNEYTSVYTVHGSVVGHTSVKVTASLPDNHTVTSATRPVEVFPPLELIPRNITLIIGALFQVLSRGGPRPQSTVVFTIKDSHVSTVTSSGLLDARSLGATKVIGQALGKDPETGETVVYSQDEAIVNVVRLTGIRIHAPLTRLQSDTMMPLYAVGLTEHETPFMFGNSIPPLSFHWSVDKKDVALLRNVFHLSNLSPHTEGNFASQLVARETGQVLVRLEVTPVRGQDQVFGDVVHTDELQIQVFEELVMLQPRTCDGQLLMTPNTEAVLKTNRDGGAKMSYTVLGGLPGGVVRVKDGLLISGSTPGQAALQVVATEDSGVVQTLVIVVKVKPVSYLMINSETKMRTTSGQLTAIPRGTTLYFTVTYHDDMGATFYATNINMKFRCSRYDLVQASHGLDNNTIIVKTASDGDTILKVWDRSKPSLVDYINIPVANVIQPAFTIVTMGSVICFTTPLTTESGGPGSWRGLGSLTVDSTSGIASANYVGGGSLTFAISEETMTSTEIQVAPVHSVSLESNAEFVTTVTNTPLTVFVNLGNSTSVQGSECLSQIAEKKYQPQRIPFSCELSLTPTQQHLDVADLFSVQPVFLSKFGRYACKISPVTTVQNQQLSTVDVSLAVSATVTMVKGQAEVTASPLTITFLPPFHVLNAEIHVSTVTPIASIRVSCTAKLGGQLQVIVSDPSILEALPPESDSQSNGIILYPIKLLDTVALWEREQLDVWVDLIGQKTGQKVKIPIFIRLIGQKPDGAIQGWHSLFSSILNNYQYWFMLLLIIIVTALTVLFGYHAVYGPRHTAALNTSGQKSPSPAGPGGSPPPYYPYYSSPGSVSPGSTPKAATVLWSAYTPLPGTSPNRRRSPMTRYSPS
ncbi:nuclear pore membrane glycoprotein 210-like isoform X2 [Dreissena polymorpha]|uniref:nuclear pore membrane glycoprotein 210-like isoform X2 n=1 Tax=Dreissena polymorpha TaxID=45954 RepID=UPI0022650B62|nr:nuclear pore membrane glycoprotein 210-like isoform X2 [Dreissena polymorpha]